MQKGSGLAAKTASLQTRIYFFLSFSKIKATLI